MTAWTLSHTLTLVCAVAGIGRAWWERRQEDREIQRERARLYRGAL